MTEKKGSRIARSSTEAVRRKYRFVPRLALDRKVLPKKLRHQTPEKDQELVFPVDDEDTLFRFNAFDDGGGDVRDVHFQRIALAVGQQIRVNEAGSHVGKNHRAVPHRR